MIDACVNIAPTRDLDLNVSTIVLLLFDRFLTKYRAKTSSSRSFFLDQFLSFFCFATFMAFHIKMIQEQERNKTLPKAQRTRGLSSSYQSLNKFKHKS